MSLDALGERVSGWLGHDSATELDTLPARHAIQVTLDALPLGEREALLLHSLAGFTAREIAEILRISPDAAARRVSRGSQRFRQLYSGDSGAEPPAAGGQQEQEQEGRGR